MPIRAGRPRGRLDALAAGSPARSREIEVRPGPPTRRAGAIVVDRAPSNAPLTPLQLLNQRRAARGAFVRPGEAEDVAGAVHADRRRRDLAGDGHAARVSTD